MHCLATGPIIFQEPPGLSVVELSVVPTTRRVVSAVREENVPFKAASIAYYAVASFVPLLLLALTTLSLFGMADILVETLRSTLSASGVQVLDTVLTNTSGRQVAGLLGVAFTVWSASKVFRGLTIAFEELYDTGTDLSLVDQLVKSLVVIAVLVLAFVFLSSTTLLLELEAIAVAYPVVVGNLLATVLMGVALFPFYYVLPPTSTTFAHAVPGTVVAAAGWVSLQFAFFLYVQHGGGYSAYGLLGAVLLFITFLYFAANVLLLGAVVNTVLDW